MRMIWCEASRSIGFEMRSRGRLVTRERPRLLCNTIRIRAVRVITFYPNCKLVMIASFV